MTSVIRRWSSVPGVLLVAALIFAPWFWGSTWPLGVGVLDLLSLGATLAGLPLIVGLQEKPFPGTVRLGIVWLLLAGWAAALNSHGQWNPATGFFDPPTPILAWLPASVDHAMSVETMAHTTALLGAFLLAAFLGRRTGWRRIFLATLAVTAVSIALLGCVQRLSGAGDIFWGTTRRLDFFFATYRNVTNAGEYLNLAFPLVLAVIVRATIHGRAPLVVAGGALAAALLLVGLLVCGSKIAPVITALETLLFGLLARRPLAACFQRMDWRAFALTLLIIVGALAILAQSIGLDVSQDRWHRLLGERQGFATISSRLLVDRACLLALPDAGTTGFGPGTFPAVFPLYSGRVPGDLPGYWTHAHNDYLQSLLEWGGLGGAAWAVLFFGGLAVALQGRRRGGWSLASQLEMDGILAALAGVAVMAAIDFPLQIASLQLQVAVLLGLAWSSPFWSRARHDFPGHDTHHRKTAPPKFLAPSRRFTNLPKGELIPGAR